MDQFGLCGIAGRVGAGEPQYPQCTIRWEYVVRGRLYWPLTYSHHNFRSFGGGTMDFLVERAESDWQNTTPSHIQRTLEAMVRLRVRSLYGGGGGMVSLCCAAAPVHELPMQPPH